MTTDSTIKSVVDGGYCVGCGACAAVTRDIKMNITEDGRYQASLPSAMDFSEASKVCPFASATDEDVLSQRLFSQEPSQQKDSGIGIFLGCFAGHVKTPTYRDCGSSGGMASWLACRLLEKGHVDAVVHVKPVPNNNGGHPYFTYALSSSAEDIRSGAKSRYYPIEMSEVIRLVRQDRRRYLFIGLPCFVKALRLLQERDKDLAQRVPFTLGLVCGHLKTMQFADFYAYSLGVCPENIATLNFRHKISNNAASDYGVELTDRKGNKIIGENRVLFGTGWGYGFFKNNACDYCDDVLAETADVAVGDAWLPAYRKDWQGTNIVVVRNRILLSILQEALQKGELHLDSLSAKDVSRSQDSGLRHRRQGLSYRLWLKDKAGEWRPRKRVEASLCHEFGRKFQRTQKGRMRLARTSRSYFQNVRNLLNFFVFCLRMRVLTFLYDAVSKGFLKASISLLPFKTKRYLKSLLKRPA